MHHDRLSKPVCTYRCCAPPAHHCHIQAREQTNPEPVGRIPSEQGDPLAAGSANGTTSSLEDSTKAKDSVDGEKHTTPPATPTGPQPGEKDARSRKQSPKGAEPFDQAEREEMERMLEELRGHLGMSIKFRVTRSC